MIDHFWNFHYCTDYINGTPTHQFDTSGASPAFVPGEKSLSGLPPCWTPRAAQSHGAPMGRWRLLEGGDFPWDFGGILVGSFMESMENSWNLWKIHGIYGKFMEYSWHVDGILMGHLLEMNGISMDWKINGRRIAWQRSINQKMSVTFGGLQPFFGTDWRQGDTKSGLEGTLQQLVRLLQLPGAPRAACKSCGGSRICRNPPFARTKVSTVASRRGVLLSSFSFFSDWSQGRKKTLVFVDCFW